MLDVFQRWYQRKFSDPDAVMLLLLILVSSIALVFWGEMMMPVIVSAVIAYLLDWPVVRLQKVGVNRTLATAIVLMLFVSFVIVTLVGFLPVISKQSVNLLQEMPQIATSAQEWIRTLPEKYPSYINVTQVADFIDSLNEKASVLGESLIAVSFNTLGNVAALLIYMILVPLMVFFMLKDKDFFLNAVSSLLPNERRLIAQVGNEMNGQIANYIRGKVIEIFIVGGVSYITFALMDLRYAMLLGALVGLSVLIPYIGAAVVTIPVAMVALFQWGISPQFGYLMFAYGIIQALDGNLLVPILFSEAVSLHPLYIIVAVLFFGGLWGFWGVFFAIPLATLVKALITAWSSESSAELKDN
ncbi:AI-2E family transporter [Alteromonas sp. 5E99-2]|uniref:AI-2E family transporter n=1 Tax=Alteromonas sp. 5E99-2 TaxID=2817683 RepID=UPI001A988ECC|nr:AI-2E family transporter [Alteromonas sp. 5E99-2]